VKATAQVVRTNADARAELLKIQRAYAQLSGDELEYQQQVQDHLYDVYKQIADATFGLPKALKIINDARKILMSDDADDASKQAAQVVVDNAYDQMVNQLVSNLTKEYGKDLLNELPAEIGKGVLKEAPAIIDTIFDLFAIHEDQIQREELDQRREALDSLRDYWIRKLQGDPVPDTPPTPPGYLDVDPRVLEFQRAMSQLGIRVTTPADAVKSGAAKITADAINGYSQANVQIVSMSNEWLALNASGAYLIPGSGSSGSQRLGLVSPVQGTFVGATRLDSPVLLASASLMSIQLPHTRSPAAYSRRDWVLVAPHAVIVIPFHTVCLDHGRGVPRPNEQYYLADRPLPAQLQRILFAASLNGTVPQSQIWAIVERDGIKWYDPRDDFGILRITFTSDNIAPVFKLGATVWVDGKQVLDNGDVRDQTFSVRVSSGQHELEILPSTTEGKGLSVTKERKRTMVKIEYGSSASFLAVVHLTTGFPTSTVSVPSVTQVH
jgi:hypothetical protein